jgi:transcriptional pleiotropic regulator of transition state genes
MKSTGIVRKVDDLGRIVIPMELRKTLGIAIKDPIEIFTEGENIILKKYKDSCIFCGSNDGLTEYMDKVVCGECRKNISK